VTGKKDDAGTRQNRSKATGQKQLTFWKKVIIKLKKTVKGAKYQI